MKSRLFLVTFLLVLWGGVTFGQGRGTEKRITASFSGIPLSEAIGTIEKTSGYTFFYDAKKTDLTQKVSLSARNMPIAEAISSMLKTTNLGFEIANMQVVLFLKEKKPAAPQSKEIDATGKVTDHEGNPLVGVTVVTETGNRGTTTGNDGRFFIRVPQGAYLIFSYLGYENQTLKAVLGMSVTLKEDSKSMEAVVVVGYGTQKKANLLGHPVVLDPVGAGASQLRTDTANRLLREVKFTVIRGNISEVKTLASGAGTTKGVDADVADRVTEENLDGAVAFAKAFAAKTGAVVAITGAIDIVADGTKAYCIRNGHPMMSAITGTGCQLSALTAAFITANPGQPLEAAAAAVCAMGLAGEIAHARLTPLDGNATYRNYIIDAIYNMTPAQLEEGAKYEVR